MQADAHLTVTLEEWLAQASDATDLGYPCIRCAGLSRALMTLVGKDNTALNAGFDALVHAALAIVARGDMDNLAARDHVAGEMFRYANLYAARMASNIDATGKAFEGDAFIGSDMMACGRIADFVMRKGSDPSA